MTSITKVAAAALALGLAAPAAEAGSELFPGISTGIPMGLPLPEGVYVISIPTYGERDGDPRQNITAIAPAWLIWSTPVTIAGGRLLLDTVMPFANIDIDGGPTFTGFTNPIIDAQLKWDLGGGFFGGFQTGLYLPVDSEVGREGIAFQGLAALSYFTADWNITTTLIYGTGEEGAGGAPAWFNADFTLVRKFGQFQFGAVAFASTDLSSPYPAYQKQSQFAAGGLIGYDFGPVNVQLKLTTDLYQENYGGRDTRVWANFIIPIWSPGTRVAGQ